MAVRLDIGGGVEREGWVLIDRKVGKEAYPLTEYVDNSVDEIRASHVLEHFPYEQCQDVLNEWARVLKPGGRLKVAVPDFRWVCLNYMRGHQDNYQGYLLGGHTDPDDKHHAIFDEPGLKLAMQRAGLLAPTRWDSEFGDDCAALPVSLNIQATKPVAGLFEKVERLGITRKVACCTSLPRYMPSATYDCVVQTCAMFGIAHARITGAYWHQCLDRAITEKVLPAGFEWIWTVDGDTVFKPEAFVRLATLFEAHPEADALVCLQMGREKGSLMLNKQSATAEDMEEEITPAKTAHFGMSLFRVKAFEKLKRPWFAERPAPDGTWGEGRRDADMVFWDNWIESGNTLFVTPRLGVGHLEEHVVWPSESFEPIVQNVNGWITDGVPAGARR